MFESPKDRVDLKGFFAIVVLTLLWGVNYSAIKYTNTGLAPIFTTFLRSVIASALGVGYCLAIKQPLFHRDIRLFHGIMTGLLFGGEFVCLYLGMFYTDAARTAILMYLAPFVVAIGAHLFLCERLDTIKTSGLVLAFIGVYLVLKGKPAEHGPLMLLGDALIIIAAIMWGTTTLYIKKYLARTVHPINTFLYQFVFSIPIIFVCSCFIEKKWIIGVTTPIVLLLLYQSVIVAFASYLVWFKLIHAYPVGRLSVFTFLAPVFGVAFGSLALQEQVTGGLIAGLILVSLGIYCTNYTRARA